MCVDSGGSWWIVALNRMDLWMDDVLYSTSGEVSPDGRFLIRLSGEIDLMCRENLQQLRFQYLRSPARDVVADVSGVVFMDSAGLSALVSFHNAAIERGGRLSLAGAAPNLRRLLGISGLDQVFTLTAEVGPGTDSGGHAGPGGPGTQRGRWGRHGTEGIGAGGPIRDR